MDALLGVRWYNTEIDLESTTLPTLSGTADEDIFDLTIGSEVRIPLSEKWGLAFRGDVGGFDLGDSTKLSWSLWGLVDYRFEFLGGEKALRFGYGHLDMDFEEGNTQLDVQLSGPVVSMRWLF